MRKMGKKEGTALYANWVTWPNTTHASRLMMLASKPVRLVCVCHATRIFVGDALSDELC